MKKFIKKIVNALAVIMVCVFCFSFVACGEDLKRVEVTFSIYNASEEKLEDKTLSIDLYRHLAPKTVDSILENINNGYYEGTVPYFFGDAQNAIMLGDLKFNNGLFEQNTFVKTIEGEFDIGGTVGSNLKSKPGSIGIWRTWGVDEQETSSNSAHTGRATWYIPTSEMSGFNGNFCVFAQFELTDEDNKETYNLISQYLKDSSLTQNYAIYFTGEYNQDNNVKNNGLEFHCLRLEDYENMSDKSAIFEPKGLQYQCYAMSEIVSAFYDVNSPKPYITVKSVKVK